MRARRRWAFTVVMAVGLSLAAATVIAEAGPASAGNFGRWQHSGYPKRNSGGSSSTTTTTTHPPSTTTTTDPPPTTTTTTTTDPPPTTTTTTTDPPSTPTTGSMSAPAGYNAAQLTFDDQFSGTTLNTSNWNTYLGPGTAWQDNGTLASPYSGYNEPGDDDLAIYSSSQVSVDNGLTLSAVPYSGQYSSLGYSWLSGVVTSKNPLPSTGWYVQVKAQMPDTSAGMWPAIWFLPSSSTQEFDGFEGGWQPAGAANTQGHSDIFYGSTSNESQDQQVWPTPAGADINAGYNVYGFEYTPGSPGSVTAYVNGTKVYSASVNLSQVAYYLFLQLQVAAGSTNGWHTTGGTSDQSMKIAEVQVYS